MILRPHGRKQNQRLMNHWQSTSIAGKHESENHEEGVCVAGCGWLILSGRPSAP